KDSPVVQEAISACKPSVLGHIAYETGKSAVTGAIGGVVTGAAIGAPAGGVGAIPGAAAGAAFGTIVSGIAGGTIAAIRGREADLVCVEEHVKPSDTPNTKAA